MKFKLVSDDNRRISLNMDAIQIYVGRYKPGTAFDFEIVRRQPRKSKPLQGYYFRVVLPTFMSAVGYEPEDTLNFHRQLKIVYFQVKPDKRGIYREKDIPSVFSDKSNLDVSKKVEFVEWVKRKGAENDVYIPDPGE
jgi:hypothetical protein